MSLLAQHLARQDRARQDAAAAELVQGLLGSQGTPGQHLLPAGQAGPQVLPQGGEGLLADINDPNRQAIFAAGLLGSSATRQVGSSLLGGVFSDQGAMDRQKSANAAAFRRSQLSSATSMTNAQLQREQAQRQFQDSEQAKVEKARLDRQAKAAQAGIGTPATGYQRILTEQGFQDIMVPGGQPYQNAQGAAIKTRDSVQLVDNIIEQLIGADGFESFGRIAGELQAQTQMIRDQVREARGFGAPQEAELKLLEEQIPDISKLMTRAGFSQKSKVLGIYTQLRAELARSFSMQQQQAGLSNIPELRGGLAAIPTDATAALPEGFTVGRQDFQMAPTRSPADVVGGGRIRR
jgi:hypothetical protein